MIRNEKEYKIAAERLEDEKKRLTQQEAELAERGLDATEIKNLIDPLKSFYLQLQEEVESYERLKRGQFEELENLRGLGHLLVSLRIAQDMTQKELAEKLGVDPTQISRDERNDYHGISIDRTVKVLDALGVQLTTQVRIAPKAMA